MNLITQLDVHTVAVIIFIVTVAVLLGAIVGSDNPLKWWHVLASKGADGSYYFDGHKFVEIVALLVSSCAVLIVALRDHMDGFILLSYLAFGSGPAMFMALVRARYGTTPSLPDKSDEHTPATRSP